MLRRLTLVWLALVGLPASALVGLPATAHAEAPVVIVLSWDGVRHDYLERLELPALGRMARDGARAERMIPIFPSNTFPNHVALATGTHSDRHGIVNNVFRDSARGKFDHSNDASWIQAEPIWSAAERQGVRSAVFFWVGSETDWGGYGATYRKAPFDEGIGEDEKVDQVLRWLDFPERVRPRLIMCWWRGADSAGHQGGPDDPDVASALASQDRELARLLAALDERDAWDHTTLLVVSDHGMVEVDESLDVAAVLSDAGIDAQVYPMAATAHVFLADGADPRRAERVLGVMPHVSVHRGDALPARLRANHPTRNGDLVLMTEPPRTFYQPTGLAALWIPFQLWLGNRFGMHGYDPERPDMGTIFLALGRGVPSGARPGVVRTVDVAPTLAKLLGIEPPSQAEGQPIAGLDY